jgi:hypothetical protein
VKVSKSIFDVEDGLKIANRTCWIFEYFGYGRMSAWKKQECLNIWQRITHSMEDVDHWNVLLFLPAAEDVEEVKEWLQLPGETTNILDLSYVFASQCKEKGQEVKGEARVFAKVKAVGSIIVILCHPRSSTSRLNIVGQSVTIDPVFIEPDTWDICTNFKEARNPHASMIL